MNEDIVIGIFLGFTVGLCLAVIQAASSPTREVQEPNDKWIDEAFERAIQAADHPLREL